MVTTVTQKNMVTIPAEVGRKFGIKPGWRLDWQPVEGREEILVRVIPDRGELARRLLGAGRQLSTESDAVAELVAERTADRLCSVNVFALHRPCLLRTGPRPC
jgi:AbrB family looped-hinge helix DNA binding protein